MLPREGDRFRSRLGSNVHTGGSGCCQRQSMRTSVSTGISSPETPRGTPVESHTSLCTAWETSAGIAMPKLCQGGD